MRISWAVKTMSCRHNPLFFDQRSSAYSESWFASCHPSEVHLPGKLPLTGFITTYNTRRLSNTAADASMSTMWLSSSPWPNSWLFSSFSSDSPPATGLPPRMMVRFTNIFNHSYCWSEQSTGRSLSSMQYQIYLGERYLSQEGCSIQTRSDHSSSWTIALQKDLEGNPWKNKH